LKWQVAGEEFETENAMAWTATGFLGAGVFPTQITANEVERTRYDAMDDMLATTSVAFLGMTVSCARCHDHKFDPIPTADYYAMAGIFRSTELLAGVGPRRGATQDFLKPELFLPLSTSTKTKDKQARGTAADASGVQVTAFENEPSKRDLKKAKAEAKSSDDDEKL